MEGLDPKMEVDELMAKLEILKFPDPRLRKKSLAVKEVTPELAQLAEDMKETMYSFNGIGLAAPQVNHLVRLLITDTRPREEGRYKIEDMTELEQKVEQPFVIFNPVVVKKEGKTTYDEGCLSVPTFYETVQRAEWIEVEGLNIKGEKISLQIDGLLSICIQHEIDHLDGKLFIDRLSPIKSNRIKSRIKKFGYPELEDDDENEEEEVVSP